MKIIDAHVHFSRNVSFEDCAKQTSLVDFSERGYLAETGGNMVERSVCMGLTECDPAGFPDKGSRTPMLADLAEQLPPGMSLCPGINPHMLGKRNLDELAELARGACKIKAVKIYAGYYHVDINDPIYAPVYDLAEKYDLTVAIHTGDTYSSKGLLKYSHPLLLDELAVNRPDIRFVACHMGTPWVFDACEVCAKNPNVYIDLSGLLVGNAEYIGRMSSNALITDRYKQALCYLDNYDKVIYGSDWPLVPMGAYISFIKKLIPEDHHDKVFRRNAEKVYKLI